MAKDENRGVDEESFPALNGHAWVLGDHVTAAVARAALDDELTRRFAAGDFLIAGVDFASDVTDRTMALALKQHGVAAVIARSFGHVFARTAIHLGLPAVVVEETGAIKMGDRLRVDLEARIVANLSSGDRYVVRSLDDEALAILRAGDIVAYTRRVQGRP